MQVVFKQGRDFSKNKHTVVFGCELWYNTSKEQIMKTSIRFFENIPVRAVWDEDSSKWWYCAVDIVEALTGSSNPRVYWNATKQRKIQLSTICKQLKLTAKDGKRYLTDVVDDDGINLLLALIPSKKSQVFEKWLKSMGTTLDDKSKQKAYELYESGIIDDIEVGTVKGLQQIHAYLFGGLYDFAGKIREVNIAKGNFSFAPAMFLQDTLRTVEQMSESSIDEIVDKYVEMNVAHPFMEGNGRSTRIWLDQILKARQKVCVDWSKIDKTEYLDAMRESPVDSSDIRRLIKSALTNKIDDREVFLKGVDYSYYYET